MERCTRAETGALFVRVHLLSVSTICAKLSSNWPQVKCRNFTCVCVCVARHALASANYRHSASFSLVSLCLQSKRGLISIVARRSLTHAPSSERRVAKIWLEMRAGHASHLQVSWRRLAGQANKWRRASCSLTSRFSGPKAPTDATILSHEDRNVRLQLKRSNCLCLCCVDNILHCRPTLLASPTAFYHFIPHRPLLSCHGVSPNACCIQVASFSQESLSLKQLLRAALYRLHLSQVGAQLNLARLREHSFSTVCL